MLYTLSINCSLSKNQGHNNCAAHSVMALLHGVTLEEYRKLEVHIDRLAFTVRNRGHKTQTTKSRLLK